ncbi:SNF1-related protein kinase regulatory subunit beta-1 isoform X1 [Phalaenopsis equestris]|uniref:SNF1-related protein kinase regulatory subunit beta-1 isoform X1 n=1 Tax=Phalaenopsis equestris TaxID=78828 RepID=UPI0009E28D43|nr:SNF1-related protein kinase regulatory subunit beta-1 isoform X1 [Phalaenopsis equestris]
MGNSSGKEEIENESDDSNERSDGEPTSRSGGALRSRSLELIRDSRRGNPGQARSPMFSPRQAPVAPLQRPSDIPPVHSQYWMNDPYIASDTPREKEIPVLITWNHGGNSVLVEGSWDNWSSRKTLQRTGKDHSILIVLPSGVYQYRFIVDGRRRHVPELPFVPNDMNNFNNVIDVDDYVPDDLQSVSEFEPPPSPDSSYSRPFPTDEDFAKEPPAVPPHLHLTVLETHKPDETFIKPRHVVLNHLFIEKGWASQSLIPLGYTHRFQSKYVTVVLYKSSNR